MAFAAGWTPCIGPILGGIIGLTSLNSSVGQGAVLLVAYAIGLGIPFILVAVGATAANRRLVWFRNHEAGVALITGGDAHPGRLLDDHERFCTAVRCPTQLRFLRKSPCRSQDVRIRRPAAL